MESGKLVILYPDLINHKTLTDEDFCTSFLDAWKAEDGTTFFSQFDYVGYVQDDLFSHQPVSSEEKKRR